MILLMCANPREHHPSYSRGIHTQNNADPSRAALPGCACATDTEEEAAEEGSEAPGRLAAREAGQVPGFAGPWLP